MKCIIQLQFVLLIAFYLNLANGLPPVVRIGGIFAGDELEEQLVLHAVIERINNNYNKTIFQSEIMLVERANSYMANAKSMFCIFVI